MHCVQWAVTKCFVAKNIWYKNTKSIKTKNWKRLRYLPYSKCSAWPAPDLPFCLGKGSKQQLEFSSDAACQASQDGTVRNREHCLKKFQTPMPRGELKPTSVTSQSWLGETGHLQSAEFSSKGIQRGKNRKASEDLHNSSVQYNLCFRWENYLRLGSSHLISQMWGMSTGVDVFRLPSSKNGKHLTVRDRYASNGSWEAEVGRRWVWGLP